MLLESCGLRSPVFSVVLYGPRRQDTTPGPGPLLRARRTCMANWNPQDSWCTNVRCGRAQPSDVLVKHGMQSVQIDTWVGALVPFAAPKGVGFYAIIHARTLLFSARNTIGPPSPYVHLLFFFSTSRSMHLALKTKPLTNWTWRCSGAHFGAC